MSTQRNKPYRHVLGTVLFSAGYMAWSLNAVAETNLTNVEVSFDLERNIQNLKPVQILKALEGPMLDELIREVQTKVVNRCQDRFPYLNWIGASEPAASRPTRVRLEIRMKGQYPSDKLYLECTLVIEGNRQDAGTAIIYDTDETHPDPCNLGQQEFKTKVLDRTKWALVRLIPDASRLGNNIPLMDVLYAEPNDELLILPVLADDFNAGLKSELYVRFVSTWPASSPKPAHIECEIFDKIVDHNHVHFGMQTCMVKLFSYPGHPNVNGWCNEISLTLKDHVQDSLSVFMVAHIDERIGTYSGTVTTP